MIMIEYQVEGVNSKMSYLLVDGFVMGAAVEDLAAMPIASKTTQCSSVLLNSTDYELVAFHTFIGNSARHASCSASFGACD